MARYVCKGEMVRYGSEEGKLNVVSLFAMGIEYVLLHFSAMHVLSEQPH